AVLIDVDGGARLTAGVEPKAAGDAAALVRAKRGLVVRVAERGLKRFGVADPGKDRPVGGLGSLLGRVFLAQQERIHAQAGGQFVEDALHREGADWRPWGAVGCD